MYCMVTTHSCRNNIYAYVYTRNILGQILFYIILNTSILMAFDADAEMSPAPHVTLVVAATSRLGIGLNGSLPWRIKAEMAYFSRVTQRTPSASGTVNAVIMGRKTYLSIPAKFRPLPKRKNIILSHQQNFSVPEPTVEVSTSLSDAVTRLAAEDSQRRIYVIGGGAVYESALADTRTRHILFTAVRKKDGSEVDCDTFFPEFRRAFRRSSQQELCQFVGEQVDEGWREEGDWEFEYQLWEKENSTAT